MSNEPINAGNVSVELLQSILGEAGATTTVDKDGDIALDFSVRMPNRDATAHGRCYVILDAKGGKIKLMQLYRINPSATQLQVLTSINNINVHFVMMSASLMPDNKLTLIYDMPLEEDLPRETYVSTVMQFCGAAVRAIEEWARDIMN